LFRVSVAGRRTPLSERLHSVSNLNPLSGTHVSNADFRRWREQNQKGGDFMIFSDLKVIKLASPEVFFVK
jgi:hypothetical protein